MSLSSSLRRWYAFGSSLIQAQEGKCCWGWCSIHDHVLTAYVYDENRGSYIQTLFHSDRLIYEDGKEEIKPYTDPPPNYTRNRILADCIDKHRRVLLTVKQDWGFTPLYRSEIRQKYTEYCSIRSQIFSMYLHEYVLLIILSMRMIVPLRYWRS